MRIGTRAWGAWRRTACLASVAVVTAGVLVDGVVAGPAQAAASAGPATSCGQLGGADARVRAGYAGVDPNSLTPAQSVAWDAALQQSAHARGAAVRAAASRFTTISIDVRVHVLARDDGYTPVTRAQVQDQIRVLNDAYSGRVNTASAYTPFRFRIASYDVTKNTDWYTWDSESDDIQAKGALHKGGHDDLNMYLADLGGGLLGYSSFAQQQRGYRDGVVLLDQSLPGGALAPYNEGDTATHEIGHWLGLEHTFQNGCMSPGDHVDDTPYQADGDNIFFCRASDDTCPARPGKDPVHNFMSYGDDPCLNQFTDGQAYRMLLSWLTYRAPSA